MNYFFLGFVTLLQLRLHAEYNIADAEKATDDGLFRNV